MLQDYVDGVDGVDAVRWMRVEAVDRRIFDDLVEAWAADLAALLGEVAMNEQQGMEIGDVLLVPSAASPTSEASRLPDARRRDTFAPCR